MADLVVRATLRDDVLPQLARIEAGMKIVEKSMRDSNKRMSDDTRRTSQKNRDEIFKIDNAMKSVARRMTGRIALIGAAIVAAAGNAVALVDALAPMTGALAAIPAVAFAGVGGLAALVLGFHGLTAAMKKTSGGASNTGDQIAAAEHRIATAQRSATQAQQDVNDAREQAVKDLRDMALAEAHATLNVQESALAVKEAQQALRQARSSGNRDDRVRAELDLQEALLGQQEAQNNLTDTTKQYQDMQAKGVENSETVQQALQRQADATYELAQAQKALKDAQSGGGGANAQALAYAKLSDAGKKLVDTFHALGPAWRDVQKATQQALLSGVSDDIRKLSSVYLPVMKAQLPAIADGWNRAFGSLTKVASAPGFVADMNKALGDSATMWQRIGDSFGLFFNGFRNWVAIGSDFLPRLGSWVERIGVRFDLWSAAMRETGQGAKWIDHAVTVGHQFNQLVGSWFSSLHKIFALGARPGFLQALVDGSVAFQHWLDTAQGQQRITDMWGRMQDVGSQAWRVIKALLDIMSRTDLSGFATVLGAVATALELITPTVKYLNPILKPLVVSMVAMKVATMGIGLGMKLLNPLLLTFKTNAKAAAVETEALATAEKGAAVGGAGMVAAGKTATPILAGLSGILGPLTVAMAAFWTAYDYFPHNTQKWRDLRLFAFGGITEFIHKSQDATPVLGKLRDAADDTTTAMLNTSDSFRTAAGSLDTYMNKIRSQTDPLFGYLDAQQELADAQSRYADALKRTKKDPHDVQAQRDLADATEDLSKAQFDMLGAQTDLAQVNGPMFLEWLNKLRDSGEITKTTYDMMAGIIAKIPGEIAKVNGARIKLFIDPITAAGGGNGQTGSRGGTIQAFAEGGVVPGPKGAPVPAIVHGGEVVIPAKDVGKASGHAMAGGATPTVRLELAGPAEVKALLKLLIRNIVRVDGGGNVQVAFGR